MVAIDFFEENTGYIGNIHSLIQSLFPVCGKVKQIIKNIRRIRKVHEKWINVKDLTKTKNESSNQQI